MSGSALDVDKLEALLEGTGSANKTPSIPANDDHKSSTDSPRARDNGRRDRSRGRRDPAARGDDFIPLSDDKDADKSRYRSRSREDDRFRSRRDDHRDRNGHGDRHRGGRARSRSPRGNRDRFYRPPPRRDEPRREHDRSDHRDDREDRRRDGQNGGRSRSNRSPDRGPDDRDKRTVFIRQLAGRAREKDISRFFESHGLTVRAASVVTDRVSKRSKGIGYVEFVSEDSVKKALDLTGQKICGLPIIVAETEAEKNRAAAAAAATGNSNAQNPEVYKKLYVGNIHFSITEVDLRAVFEPFGDIEGVAVEKDEANGRSKGFGFVQFADAKDAKTALADMNGFQLAGRPIRVGLGGDRFTAESTNNLLKSQASSNTHSSGAGNRAERGPGPSARDIGAASALDDADVAGVAFTSHGRDSLMRKLAREDDGLIETHGQPVFAPRTAPMPSNPVRSSACVRLSNMFTAQDARGGVQWAKGLEEEIREECEEQYGKVIHISVDANSSEGIVYVKFDREQGGENAMNGLNGRWFGGQRIGAQFVPAALYRNLFPKSG